MATNTDTTSNTPTKASKTTSTTTRRTVTRVRLADGTVVNRKRGRLPRGATVVTTTNNT